MLNFKKFYMLERRQYIAKHGKVIMYHGTSNKFLKSILSNGLLPEYKEKVWSDDKYSGFDQPSRVSYGGIYLTNNLVTAISSARTAIEKVGGNNIIIVCVEIQPRTTLPDEDNFKFKIEYSTDYAVGYAGKYLGKNELLNVEAYLDYILNNSNFEKKLTWFIEYMNKMFNKIWPKEMNEILRNKLKNVFVSSIARRISYIPQNTLKSLLYRISGEIDEEQFNNIISLNKDEAEKNYMKDLIQLMNTFKSEAYKNLDDFNKTIRITEPIFFTGNNKIVSIIEIISEPSNPYSEIVVHYGKILDKFLSDYRKRIGNNIKIMEKTK